MRKLFIAPLLVLIFSCSEPKSHTAAAVNERDSVPVMVSYGVNTLISDSGVIKYRIVTERWEVNTVRHPSRWVFEKGIFMEQYDKTFHIEGYIQADSAWYFDQQKLWELRGRVSIRNVDGMRFNSEELFWDGIKHEFYSHRFSRLVTPERMLEGTYFRSNEQMTHYEVSNSVGSFETATNDEQTPADNEPQKPAALPFQQAATAPADSVVQDVRQRPAATHRRSTIRKTDYQP